MVRFIVCLFILASITLKVYAVDLPSEQWNSQTHLWLARAVVGEAGWRAENDHIAIPYVLLRRWKTMSRRWPDLKFKGVILAYAKALGGGRSSYTPRQQWIRRLNFEGLQPDHWPAKANWKYHKPIWYKILNRLDDWRLGRVPDPCRGKAEHWGGEMDKPLATMHEVDCGDTVNKFYGISVGKSVSKMMLGVNQMRRRR